MHYLTQNFCGKKLRNHDENETIWIIYDNPKVAYPWRVSGIKITRIHEFENAPLIRFPMSLNLRKHANFLIFLRKFKQKKEREFLNI